MLKRLLLLLLISLEQSWAVEISKECFRCYSQSQVIKGTRDLECLEREITVCGRYNIQNVFYQDCQHAVNDKDYKSCTKNVRCAEQCIQAYVRRYISNCNVPVVTCREVATIVAGGPSCNEDGNEIRDVLRRMEDNCPRLMKVEGSTTFFPGHEDPTNTTVIIVCATLGIVIVIVLVAVGIRCIVLKRIKRSLTESTPLRSPPAVAELELVQASNPREPCLRRGLELQGLTEFLKHNCSDDILIQDLSQYHLARADVGITQPIGSGHFANVYKGFYKRLDGTSKTAAVKVIKSNLQEYTLQALATFLQEASIMAEFEHENVLSLIGFSWEAGEVPLMVIPFMSRGDLQKLIRSESLTLSAGDLLNFATQVAEGLAYMTCKKFVHRDIAARNCLVDEFFIVKIADFGLSKDVYSSENYLSSDVRSKALPWKWMAPECMEQGEFSSKSDVWSFGVLMWELFTHGATPYPAISSLVHLEESLRDGYQLAQPIGCPEDIYALMRSTWERSPAERPTPKELLAGISGLLKEHEGTVGYEYTVTNSPTLHSSMESEPKYLVPLSQVPSGNQQGTDESNYADVVQKDDVPSKPVPQPRTFTGITKHE